MSEVAENADHRRLRTDNLRHVAEIGLVAIAFLLYFLVRGAVVDDPRAALDHAYDVIDLEQSLGIFWEPRLQDLIIDHRMAVQAMNFIYFWLDFPLIVLVGLLMYFRGHRHEYTVVRDAMLLSGAIALLFYWLYPVMPPRLLPGDLFIGTIEKYSDLSYQASSTAAFVNPYAAVPSLHFGWAMILGGAMIYTFRNPFALVLGLMLPWMQLAAVVFTANHYIFDAFAGLVVCLVGVLLALGAQRWLYPPLGRWTTRTAPQPAVVASAS